MNFKFEPDKVFFTSDTHFFHSNIIGFCNRPFKSVEEMNETLIRNWNSVVGKDDVGVDNNNFTPVSFHQVKTIIEKQIEESKNNADGKV